MYLSTTAGVVVSLSGTWPVLVTSLVTVGGVLGALNIFDDDDDEEQEDDDLLTEDDGGLFDDDGDEDVDDLGELDDDWGDEVSEDDELEQRIEELETEMSELSSTVSTVRSENEEIAGSVEEIEENVRKLLDIYEMVTRGVNPFVDEAAESPFGGDDDIDVFGTDDEPETEDLDDDITDEDAEAFFDDDFDGDATGDAGDPFAADDADGFGVGGEDGDGGDGFADPDDGSVTDGDGGNGDNGVDHEDTGSSGDDEGGKSFEELKSEYEDGAGWADEGGETGTDDGDDAAASETVTEPDPEPAPDTDNGSEPAPTTDVSPDGDRRSEPAPEREPTREPARGERERSEGPAVQGQSKPYLSRLPGEYVVDLVVMEWMSRLVEKSNAAHAHRAVAYYETIGWVSESVAEELHAYLRGITETDYRDGQWAPPEDAPTGRATNDTNGARPEPDSANETSVTPAVSDSGGERAAADGGDRDDFESTFSIQPPPAPSGLTVEDHTWSLEQIARIVGDREQEFLRAHSAQRSNTHDTGRRR